MRLCRSGRKFKRENKRVYQEESNRKKREREMERTESRQKGMTKKMGNRKRKLQRERKD